MTQLSTPSILKQIIADKRLWINKQMQQFPMTTLCAKTKPADNRFYTALKHTSPFFILECKKASPSKGIIRENFDLEEIVQAYDKHGTALSVLTDEKYFAGSFDNLTKVRSLTDKPLLCKDFFIDPYQVYLARYHGADAILLMLSVIDDDTYQILASLAHQLGMGVLTEVATIDERNRAIDLKAYVIGINNRNLHDLSVSLERTYELSQAIPQDRLIVSESGIRHHNDIVKLSQVAHGFLIGSHLMSQKNLPAAVQALVVGEHKVCGLTTPESVACAYEMGATYGGLIFVPHSLRCISLEQAKQLVNLAPLRFVGVFWEQSIQTIAHTAHTLSLYAVQLHSLYTDAELYALKEVLPTDCQIWQTIGVDVGCTDTIDFCPKPNVDRLLFDSKKGNQQGGTGTVFDWSVIPDTLKSHAMLAGGINRHNIQEALTCGFLGLDINSGAESQIGIKDPQKLHDLFQTIKIFNRTHVINPLHNKENE